MAKGADCKSAGLRLRRFESYLPHQPSLASRATARQAKLRACGEASEGCRAEAQRAKAGSLPRFGSASQEISARLTCIFSEAWNIWNATTSVSRATYALTSKNIMLVKSRTHQNMRPGRSRLMSRSPTSNRRLRLRNTSSLRLVGPSRRSDFDIGMFRQDWAHQVGASYAANSVSRFRSDSSMATTSPIRGWCRRPE